MRVIILKPVDKFFKKLEPLLWSKVQRLFDHLIEHGKFLSMPFSKRLSSNLYELRILGTVNIRIFYTFVGEEVFFLHAFIKKTHKIPKKDLDLAYKRLKQLTLYKL